MRAALYKGIRDIEMVDRPRPQAGPGEAVIRIALCGICGTDLHIYFDGMLPPGIVLGHENVGTVVEVGAGVCSVSVGDRVAVGPPGLCGCCLPCRQGRPSLCLDGFERTHGLRRDGGMAEYMLVNDAEGMIYPIPEGVSFESAVLTDTFATALHGIGMSASVEGCSAVVSGAGSIGLAAVQLLRNRGAARVTVLEPAAAKRALAERYGAESTFDPESGTPEELCAQISRLHDGRGPDLVIESAGVPASFELCIALAGPGGEVLNLGAASRPVRVDPSLLALRELVIRSSLAYGAEEARACLEFMAAGHIRTEGMLSDVISLEDLVEKGFDRLKEDGSLVKIAVAP